MFCVPFLGMWWCYDIWISEKLKFDYFKNEEFYKKTFFLVSQVFSFKYTKQTGKNLADTSELLKKERAKVLLGNKFLNLSLGLSTHQVIEMFTKKQQQVISLYPSNLTISMKNFIKYIKSNTS